MAWTNMGTKANGVVIDQGDWNQMVANFAHLGGTDGNTKASPMNFTSGNVTLSGYLLPIGDNAQSLGSGANRWAQAHVVWVTTGTVGAATGVMEVAIGANAFGGSTSQMVTCYGNVRPGVSNNFSLGASGYLWTAVYATNGTIQTSSRAAKEGETAVSAADALAAVKATKVARFKYKRRPDGPGNQPPAGPDPVGTEQIGLIAEDSHPMLTLEDGKSVNAQQTASIALLAIQALAARVEALEAA